MQNLDLEKENGRSMIEMIGVLAIIGVLSVGGIAGYSKAMQKYRVNKAIEQITLIAGNVRAFFAPQGNYEGVMCFSINGNGSGVCGSSGCSGYTSVVTNGANYTNNGCPIVKKAKIFPDEMISIGSDGKITSIINPFGSGVTLSDSHKSENSDKQAFMIRYSLPKGNEEACIELASKNWTDLGNVVISIAGTGCGGTCPVNQQYFYTPVNIDDAITACSQDSVIWIDWYVNIDVNSTYWQNIINPSS